MTDCINTERLVIRPAVAADSDAVVRILNNIEVSRWLVPIPHPFTHADLRIQNDDGSSRWPDLGAIEHKGTFVGGIGMGARLGYYLAPEVWGQGIGKEAARAAVTFSFDTIGTDSIAAGYFDGNQASRRILSGLGFVETGRGPAHCAALDKDFPSVEMRLTPAVWRARQ